MTQVAAGWYPDPAGGPAPRWWDGQQWTDHYGPVATGYSPNQYAPVASGYPPNQYAPVATGYPPNQYAPAATGYPPHPYGTPVMQPAGSLLQRNRFSAITVAIALVYAVLAIGVHIVFIGVLPILFGVRAFRAREQYRVIAAIAAGAAVLFSIAMLAG